MFPDKLRLYKQVQEISPQPEEQEPVREILDDATYIALLIRHYRILPALQDFLRSRSGNETECFTPIADFTERIAGEAYNEGTIDSELVRESFRGIKQVMDRSANAVVLPQLQASGYEDFTPRSWVRELDDTFWEQQFLQDFFDYLKRHFNASSADREELFKRYTVTCMHGFIFAPFTYL